MLNPWNLLKEIEKKTLLIGIFAENVVFSMGVKLTMNTARFGLIAVQRIENTGSIYTPLAYLDKMKMKKFLLKSQNIIEKDITLIKSQGESVP